jgi:hypothetical protein
MMETQRRKNGQFEVHNNLGFKPGNKYGDKYGRGRPKEPLKLQRGILSSDYELAMLVRNAVLMGVTLKEKCPLCSSPVYWQPDRRGFYVTMSCSVCSWRYLSHVPQICSNCHGWSFYHDPAKDETVCTKCGAVWCEGNYFDMLHVLERALKKAKSQFQSVDPTKHKVFFGKTLFKDV